MQAYIVHHEGVDVECYGTLEEDSNFSVVCEDEEDDDVWCDGNCVTDEPFQTWEEAVKHLWGEYASAIIEISAV